MHIIDWLIVIALFALLVITLTISQRFVKGASAFLVADRCAGRYLLTIANGIGGIGAISVIATFEQAYAAGFSPLWWRFIMGPIGLFMVIIGWVFYRYRETRVMTLSQFFELRYSRNFRVFSGILGWLSGLLNYGIFPAVSVRFFMYFCDIPWKFRFPGVAYDFDSFLLIMILVISIGMIFAICGGQVTIMLTDFIQGVFCNIVFLIIMIYLLGKFSWPDIFASMQQLSCADPERSPYNPFDTGGIRDFNIWFFLSGILINFYVSGTFQGSSGYNSAAKSPHEAKMAGLLAGWRGLVQNALFIFIPICAITFFHNPAFTPAAQTVNAALETISDFQVRAQMTVPMFIKNVMPVGLIGLFAAMMFAAMLSTDDTYMHSWGAIFIQDVILPFRKKPFSSATHIRLLQCSIVFVGVFAIIFSYFFHQTEAILLFMQITGAIYMGGAGAVLIGGLYTRFGTTWGAWGAMIGGSLVSLVLLALQQTWQAMVAPLLWDNFRWQWLLGNMDRCPINGQVALLVACGTGTLLYVAFSLLERQIKKTPDFNLEKMLHRGIYDNTGEHGHRFKSNGVLRLLGMTDEFSRGDRGIFFLTLGWTLLWFLIFLIGSIWALFGSIPDMTWLLMWKYHIIITFGIGIISTVWFSVGGWLDAHALIKSLKNGQINVTDDGMVIDGSNAGENGKYQKK